MKNRKINKYILWGILINSFHVLLKQFIEIPDAIACFGTGIGISLLLFGIYAMNNDISKMENWKRALVKKIIG